ncbi:replication fork protection component swi3 domain-containing protein [Ditylenchus destructor]|uniref:TIMELESS-interacting protein n=1 Tax=Ditylenchus destructor TaxID=166010 RepID=A0AAD4NEI5_9BILA|nr:replication fork protection component swi3 domain-containing protein [Ditylenchus destructor]
MASENIFNGVLDDDEEELFAYRENETDQNNELDRDKEDQQKILESVWKKSEGNKKETSSKAKPSGIRKAGPRFTERELTSLKGLPALKAAFDNHRINSNIGPYENVNAILRKMEYWAHGLYPQLNFDDFLEKTEIIGRKRLVKVTMTKLRMGMSLDENAAPENEENEDNEENDDDTQTGDEPKDNTEDDTDVERI